MRPQLCCFIFVILARLGSCQTTETKALPWWPSANTEESNLDVDEVKDQYNSLNEDSSLNEIPQNVLAADEDREAFYQLFNTLLWDADETESEGRQMYYRRRGLMQLPMPSLIKRNDNVISQTYRGFVDGCYDIFCALGLRGLASKIFDLLA